MFNAERARDVVIGALFPDTVAQGKRVGAEMRL